MNRYEEAMKELDEKLGRKDGLISLSTFALDKGRKADAAPPPASPDFDSWAIKKAPDPLYHKGSEAFSQA